MTPRFLRAQLYGLIAVTAALLLGYLYYFRMSQGKPRVTTMEFAIKTTWDDKPVNHNPVQISLSTDQEGIRIDVVAPFFNSPPAPKAPAGQPCPELWEYEVVEAFFLNDNNQYVEVELCPHGQHLVLLLDGRRQMVEDELPLEFKSQILGSEWRGSAVLPFSYLPPGVTRFNAFAIHGTGKDRAYEALYPATQFYDEPDFHRLEYFEKIDLGSLSPALLVPTPSRVWKKYVEAAQQTN